MRTRNRMRGTTVYTRSVTAGKAHETHLIVNEGLAKMRLLAL